MSAPIFDHLLTLGQYLEFENPSPYKHEYLTRSLEVSRARCSRDDTVIYDPCLVVEVTSPETARVDRVEKRDAYLTLPALLGYFVVDHRRRHVTWDARQRGGVWRRGESTDGGSVPLPGVGGTLSRYRV